MLERQLACLGPSGFHRLAYDDGRGRPVGGRSSASTD